LAQFHFEQIHREQLRHGRYNFILPNPEFTDAAVFNKLSRTPVILCKSRHAHRLFDSLVGSGLFVGFTSKDRLIDYVEKDYRKFLHVAGLSDFKGTERLARLWSRHPEWPTLTIVRSNLDRSGARRQPLATASNLIEIPNWLSDPELKRLQNQCGIHVCPSEAEGFGHYIMEGMSAGSVVITTDAAPMNELVKPSCGFLVRGAVGPELFMTRATYLDEWEMEKTVNKLCSLPIGTLEEMGRFARSRYVRLDADFRGRMKIILHQYLRAGLHHREYDVTSRLTIPRLNASH
jgi:glycosyltransferase involved in cell wall biosynthesis